LESEEPAWLLQFIENGGLPKLVKVLHVLCTTIPEDDDERLEVLLKLMLAVLKLMLKFLTYEF
jgi:hypothetical protein